MQILGHPDSTRVERRPTAYRCDVLGYGVSMTDRGDVSLDTQGRVLAAILEH